jgi:MFS family permease
MATESALDAAASVTPDPVLEGKDHAKLVMLGVLHMAQYFPAAFTAIALPAIFRQEGLPLEAFWLLALPQIPRGLKWLIALVVDAYGHPRIGQRKSWIIPCTAIGALLYVLIAFIPPTVAAVYAIVGILLLKSFIMAAQDVAVDGYAAESMTDHERSTGTSIIGFLAFSGTMIGVSLVSAVDAFGWSRTMSLAALLLAAAALPAILRPEPPPPEASRIRRERGERPSLLEALRREESRFILPFLFLFGFSGSFISYMFTPFLVDRGLSLTQIGVLLPIAAFLGTAVGAVLTPVLIARVGLKVTGLIGLAIFPIEGAVLGVFAPRPELPALPIFIAAVALVGCGTSTFMFVVNNSRFRWASKAQAATDYSMQSSIWYFGIWVSQSLAGFIAAQSGWATFFVIGAALATAVAACYVLMFDHVERLVQARERDELTA